MNGNWAALIFLIVSLALSVGWSTILHTGDTMPAVRPEKEQRPRAAARFFYFVGIPYAAVLFGVLTPRLLGLTGLEYLTFIDWSSGLWVVQLQQALTMMLLTWLLDSSRTIIIGLIAVLLLLAVRFSLARNDVNFAGVAQPVLSTLYYGLHWAFYRAIFWSITGDPYLGTILGGGFVMLEWALIYGIGRRWGANRVRFFTDTIILVLTAVIFFYSPNLWLLLPFHWLLVVIVTNRPPQFAQAIQA